MFPSEMPHSYFCCHLETCTLYTSIMSSRGKFDSTAKDLCRVFELAAEDLTREIHSVGAAARPRGRAAREPGRSAPEADSGRGAAGVAGSRSSDDFRRGANGGLQREDAATPVCVDGGHRRCVAHGVALPALRVEDRMASGTEDLEALSPLWTY